MSRFDHRSSQIEIMDDLLCEGEVVDQTLRELETINRWLGGNQVTLNGLAKLLNGRTSGKSISIADLGCGGGEMLKLVGKWTKARKLTTELVGIDANPNIIAFARQHSVGSTIAFEALDIFSDEFRRRKFDVCLATLFTHHFSDEQLVELFKWFSEHARIGTIINDIHRHWFAYHSIRLLTSLFSRSKMVRYDAPLSVLRAFRKTELEQILHAAGIENYTLRWKWAFRWQLTIQGNNLA